MEKHSKTLFQRINSMSYITAIASMLIMFISLFLSNTFHWSFFYYLAVCAKVIIVISFIFIALPDFMAKNTKKIIFDIIFIVILAFLLF